MNPADIAAIPIEADVPLPLIREVIVVEGKDDVAAVRRACEAQTIVTSGLGISREIIEQIRIARDRCGVIVLTDPDSPGERIRKIIEENVPGCKHAYVYQKKNTSRPTKGQKGPGPAEIGVEYTSPAEILEALTRAHASLALQSDPTFTISDLIGLGLSGV